MDRKLTANHILTERFNYCSWLETQRPLTTSAVTMYQTATSLSPRRNSATTSTLDTEALMKATFLIVRDCPLSSTWSSPRGLWRSLPRS